MTDERKARAPEPTRHSVLVVDDNLETLEVISRNLTGEGYQVLTAPGVEPAVEILQGRPIDLVITDYKMPKITGLDLIRHVRANHPDTEVMMITGFASVGGAVLAMKSGAEEYLAKPFTEEELLGAVQKALRKLALRREGYAAAVDEPLRDFGLIGHSAAMQRLYRSMIRAASTPATVLVTGETGTGKELVARAIHYSSSRATAPFVPVNCGGIPEGMLERELFGHLKGSFTGATETRAGFFQTANGGTLFLDEISETSAQMQVKLLRALQEKEVCMIGDTRPFSLDIRIVAATNTALPDLVQKGVFREDLYYRLAVLLVDVPPLRERDDDIVHLAHFFVEKLARQLGREQPRLSEGVLETLQAYPWPGNVRELENLVQRVIVMSDGPSVELSDLPRHMRFSVQPSVDLRRSLQEVEQEHIGRVLESVDGNKSEAARILGITRKTLRQKLKPEADE
ncbi:MAG: sigma-54 dependent transcriptional regulator [bacterium]